jgi:hypothetical protein
MFDVGVMQLQTPYGLLRPPLGSARLTVIALLAVLLRTGSQVAEEAVINSGILKQVLHLLLQYPFNSILHHQVRLRRQLFDAPSVVFLGFGPIAFSQRAGWKRTL